MIYEKYLYRDYHNFSYCYANLSFNGKGLKDFFDGVLIHRIKRPFPTVNGKYWFVVKSIEGKKDAGEARLHPRRYFA